MRHRYIEHMPWFEEFEVYINHIQRFEMEKEHMSWFE